MDAMTRHRMLLLAGVTPVMALPPRVEWRDAEPVDEDDEDDEDFEDGDGDLDEADEDDEDDLDESDDEDLEDDESEEDDAAGVEAGDGRSAAVLARHRMLELLGVDLRSALHPTANPAPGRQVISQAGAHRFKLPIGATILADGMVLFNGQKMSRHEAAQIYQQQPEGAPTKPAKKAAPAKAAHMSEADRQKLAQHYVKAYTAGASLSEIAAHSGKSQSHVHEQLVRSGVQLRGRGAGPKRRPEEAARRAREKEAALAHLREATGTLALKTELKAAGVPDELIAGVPKPVLARWASSVRANGADAVQVARMQTEVADARRAFAGTLADALEFAAGNPSERALAAQAKILHGMVGRALADWPELKSLEPVLSALERGDKAALARAVKAAARKHGLTQLGADAGKAATFDRASMEAVGRIADGAPVTVLRPGYEATINGERVVLVRPKVVPAPDEAAPKTASGGVTSAEFDRKRAAAAKGQDALDAVPFDRNGPEADNLTFGQQAALRDYNSPRYMYTNDALRGRISPEDRNMLAVDIRGMARQLDEVLAQSRLKRDVEVYRSPGSGVEILGPVQDWPDDLTGTEWVDPAFTSASADARVADRFAVPSGLRMRMIVPKGSSAIRLSDIGDRFTPDGKQLAPSEAEIVLARGARSRIVRDRGWTEIEHPTYGKMRVRDVDVEVTVPDEATPPEWIEPGTGVGVRKGPLADSPSAPDLVRPKVVPAPDEAAPAKAAGAPHAPELDQIEQEAQKLGGEGGLGFYPGGDKRRALERLDRIGASAADVGDSALARRVEAVSKQVQAVPAIGEKLQADATAKRAHFVSRTDEALTNLADKHGAHGPTADLTARMRANGWVLTDAPGPGMYTFESPDGSKSIGVHTPSRKGQRVSFVPLHGERTYKALGEYIGPAPSAPDLTGSNGLSNDPAVRALSVKDRNAYLAYVREHPGTSVSEWQQARREATPKAEPTPSEKGRRIQGPERATMARDLVKRYTSGESIEALATSTGRSYGFIHRILTESGVQLRQRGATRRRRSSRDAWRQDAEDRATVHTVQSINAHPIDTERLRIFWTKDPEGLAKWVHSPHPWQALREHLAKFIHNPGELDRTTSAWHFDVFHEHTGSDLYRVEHGGKPRGHRIGPG